MNIQLLITAALAAFVVESIVPRPVMAQNGTPPQPESFSFTIYPGDPLGSCAFPIEISAEGKAKAIALPHGNFIFTSPGLNATVTNLVSNKFITLNITGSFHQTTNSDGTVVTTANGRNLLTDPIAGVVLAIGNFSFAFDAMGNLVQPLTSQGGQLIDVCKQLE